MKYRFTVEVINGNAKKDATLPNLEIGVNNRDKAVVKAGTWNSKGYTVVIHDHLTGDRNILPNN
jgi:hypothetical protein